MDMVTMMTITPPKTTKKLLVTFDATRASATAGDFVVPIFDAGVASLFGLRLKKSSELGVMVYLGKAVTANDLFAKLVDTGRKIPDVDQAVNMLTAYMSQLECHKIGNVVAIEVAAEEPGGFRLKKIANTPSGAANAG
jgi:hypothetical protein